MKSDLVLRARGGDHDAFTALAEGAFDHLTRTARLILRGDDEAADAVQEALVAAWLHIRAVREPERFDAWLHRLLVHACYRVARRRSQRRVMEIDVANVNISGRTDEQRPMVIPDQLERGFRRLTVEQRAVLVVHHYHGLSDAEAAVVLDIPVGTFKSRLSRATAAVRASIEADDRPPAIATELNRMTATNDFERTLAGWLQAQSESLVPSAGIERVLDVTSRRRPRPALLAGLGSRWIGAAPTADLGAGTADRPRRSPVRGRSGPAPWSRARGRGDPGRRAAHHPAALEVAPRTSPPATEQGGGRLVYIVDGVVYLADSDGSNPAQMGGDSLSSGHLRLGPDGGKDVVPRQPVLRLPVGWRGEGFCTGGWVYIHDANGNAVASWFAGDGWRVEWAPDSTRVVAWGLDGNFESARSTARSSTPCPCPRAGVRAATTTRCGHTMAPRS